MKLKQLKPALAGYIRDSLILLKESGIPDDKTVHDVRVLMKKSKAVLKLVAPQMDNILQERNMDSLKEVGRLSGIWRDSSVHRKTLKEFRKESPDIFSRLSENAILTQLLKKEEPVAEPTDEVKATLENIHSLLNKTGYRIRFQSMNMLHPQLLLKELESTYLGVSEIYLTCRNKPQPESLHKFRKVGKDFLYQLYIFRPLNPPVIKVLEKKVDTLTQNLGRYHDISEIIKVLGYNYKESENPPAMHELIIKLREAQDRYLARVWPPAYQVFCPGQKLVNVLGFKLLVI